ncbi:hypothetical protein B0H14DRAFT_3474128 [Mycena olivaceomarginata]|nr:hypothetical protein B0H14DRAFT_3474128 [Mycena olivaceomarginata]
MLSTSSPTSPFSSAVWIPSPDNQHKIIASFARFIAQSLYPIELPAALNCKRQRATTPTKPRHDPDEQAPRQENQVLSARPPPTMTWSTASSALLPLPVASSSRLPTSSSFETRCATLSSPFPSTLSLYRKIYPSSSSSSSSLASPSSTGSFTNPITLLEDEKR